MSELHECEKCGAQFNDEHGLRVHEGKEHPVETDEYISQTFSEWMSRWADLYENDEYKPRLTNHQGRRSDWADGYRQAVKDIRQRLKEELA